jgi:hypothetical protein
LNLRSLTHMALDDRIRSSVDAALDQLRTRVDADVRAIVQQVVGAAAEEQEEALTLARQKALDEVAEDAQQKIDAAEARLRASMEQAFAYAREKERELDAIEIRKLVEVEAAQRQTEALDAAETRMRYALADADAKAADALKESVAAAGVREREAELAAVTRLVESIRGLDGATSLSEVLDALGQAAGREASRAALFVLRNERLLGWKLSGFGQRDSQPKTIDLGLNEAGVIGLAVGAARPVTTRDSQTAAEGPGFTHLPSDRMGFAVPVIVGGRVVAVVYADSVTEDAREHVVPSGWPEVIEVLARHAARCLEALTVQKATTTPSPRFWVPPATQAGAAAPGGKPAAPAKPADDVTATAPESDTPPSVTA